MEKQFFALEKRLPLKRLGAIFERPVDRSLAARRGHVAASIHENLRMPLTVTPLPLPEQGKRQAEG